MIAPNIISDVLPALQLTNSGEQALNSMQEYNVSQLPVLKGQQFIGLLMMDDLLSEKHLSQSIKESQIRLLKVSVSNTAHMFDVMRAAIEFNVKVVPVVDEENVYLGVVSAESCLRSFALMNSISNPGAIIELQFPLVDYSLSSIARIVEDNEAQVVCFYTNVIREEGMMEITMKVNTTNVSGLVAAFERYEYHIVGVYNDVEYSVELKDRYDALMRYLNV